MNTDTVLSRRGMLGATLALGACGISALLTQPAKPAQAAADTGNGISLLDDLEPYESRNFIDNIGSFTMAGDIYSGTTMSYNSYALYNLKGNYSELRFTFGHVDGTKETAIEVYLDDVLYKQYTATKNDLPTIVQVPISGVQVLKLAGNYKLGYGDAGIANPVVFADAAAASAIPDGDYEAEVMENGSPVTVKVTIADGLVSTLNIVSDSNSASIATLHEALGKIIEANSVEPEPSQDSGALFSAE